MCLTIVYTRNRSIERCFNNVSFKIHIQDVLQEVLKSVFFLLLKTASTFFSDVSRVTGLLQSYIHDTTTRLYPEVWYFPHFLNGTAHKFLLF